MRADLHNTSARDFKKHFKPPDFLSGGNLEDRIYALVEQGYTPSEAAAIASSNQTGEHKLFVIDKAMSLAHAKKQKGGTRRKMG